MEHEGLKNLYQQVISGKFSWDRWGLLSVLSDYVLYYTQGDILEIGLCETSIITSKLAEKYNRKCYHCDYSKSLIENMKNTKGYFGRNSIIYNGKSDNFFKEMKLTSIALAFIDGSHEYVDVKNDFWNVFEYLTLEGFIFLHDSCPKDKNWTVLEKCGTVYKLREELENINYLDVFTFTKSSFDVGLTMVKRKTCQKKLI